MVRELPSLGVPSGQPEMVDLSIYADLEIWTVDETPIESDAKPSHRAYTLTDRTLGLGRRAADMLCSVAFSVGDMHMHMHALGAELRRAVMHAQGMPEADLRRMATWVRERCSDPDLVAIADATLANLAVDAMPVGSVDVRGESQTDWADRATAAERAFATATEVAQGLSLALRRIEAISHGIAPSTVREAPEPMPVEVADALVSRLLSQFIEFGTAGARIKQLERELADAAKDRALVGATETLVRRMIDRLVETDPEWVDSLRKGGS